MNKPKSSKTILIKFLIGFIVLISTFFIALILGAAGTSIKEVWSALFTGASTNTITMIHEIRLPRETAALFVGAALSVSGAIMQGLTRNPLADPGLLGLTAGANAALAITIALIPSANYFVIMLVCFVGAALGVVLVFGIGSLKKGGFSPMRIVLAGAAVSTLLFGLSDGVGLYFKISKDVSMWTSGGLLGTTWSQLKFIIPFILIGIIFSFILSRQLTVLSLNEDIAIGLGQNITKVKTLLYVIIILLAGASVALVGNLAFVGLMVPHMVRRIVGTDYRFIIPMSAIFGASFMSLADTVARTIHAPFETPIAAIVSIIGLPFFLFIVLKGGKAIS